LFQHVLVPLDESAYSERALSYAEDLVKAGGGQLTLIVVVPESHPDPSASPDAVHRIQAERPHRAAVYLQQRLDELRTRGLTAVHTEVRSGDTADSIVDKAHEAGIDLIAMSTHGLGASGRYALGSVALKVLMTAPCPVFMVRIQEAWPSTHPE